MPASVALLAASYAAAGSERRALARAAKPRAPDDDCAIRLPQIGNRDHRVIERRRNVSDPEGILLLFLAKDFFLASRCCFSHFN